MRSPFPISIYTNRPLTDLQSLRRGRILERSKPYRDYLKRLRRTTKRRGDQRKAYPLKGGLLWRWAYKMQEKPSRFNDAYGKLDALVGIPHEQLMLEMDVWERKAGITRRLP